MNTPAPVGKEAAFTLWMSEQQREKLKRLGGARWIRAQLDAAEEGSKPAWSSKPERDKMIASDIRSAKSVARDYDVAPRTVSNIRARLRLNGKQVAAFFSKHESPPCPSSPPRSSSET